MPVSVGATLRRSRAVSIVALALLTLLAWIWLFAGAGMDMPFHASLAPLIDRDMPTTGMPMAMGAAMDGSVRALATQAALTFSMWWIMMVAMMLPSAAPAILLYDRAAGQDRGGSGPGPATGLFLAGYLAVWGGFSLAATLLHLMLERIDLIGAMTMASSDRYLSAGILIAAGLYQFSPFKNMCLRHCRSPTIFLSRHYRPGRAGALRMGVIHGAYCTGCCWLLMALLFVGGIMNLAWIALLTLVVALEKLMPHGRLLASAAGVAFLIWGTAILWTA